MTSPSPSPDRAVSMRRTAALSIGSGVALLGLKAFGFGASGSVSMLASLIETALGLFATIAGFFALRWTAGPDEAERRDKVMAIGALVQAGLIFASAAFVAWAALMRMFDPRPVYGGPWPVAIVLISILVTAGLVWLAARDRSATGRPQFVTEMASGVVVLIGVVSGVYLAAPGLDAAAGLVIAVWLFWGALSSLRPAADLLLS